MKGKKFNAAEKHFQEKELKYRKEINHLRSVYSELCNVNLQLAKENDSLKKENLDIKLKYEKLLEYSKLSESDIKIAIEGDKAKGQLTGMFNMLSKYMY